MTTSASELRELVCDRLCGARLIVVSNREPYVHVHAGGEIICQMPPGGLVTALDPVMRACGGTWIAHGSGSADRAIAAGRLRPVDAEPLLEVLADPVKQ